MDTEEKIDPDAPLDSLEFQNSGHDRYDAYVVNNDKKERVACGSISQLIAHITHVRDLCTDGSLATFKLQLPQTIHDRQWFTKTTVMRFILIIESKEALENAFAIYTELSQLEETRRLQVSLYSKGQDYCINGDKDTCNLAGVVPIGKAENRILSSDDSKMVLLRAMDSRLIALRGDLASAFNVGAQSISSVNEIMNIESFCEHFGEKIVRKLMHKLLEVSQSGQTVYLPSDMKSYIACDLSKEYVKVTDEDKKVEKQLHCVKPIVYGTSPAEVAEIERKRSTESEESSSLSEEDRSHAERSCHPVRSATPRRSASPMRRVQIGRSASRCSPALAIKSLNYNTARERTLPYRDVAPDDSEVESEKACKNPESNVKRMSVQDAINLFESKQRDQTGIVPKRISPIDIVASRNKPGLRRWSAGMGESSAVILTLNAPECAAVVVDVASNSVKVEITKEAAEVKLEETSHAAVVKATEHVEKQVSSACTLGLSRADTSLCPSEETKLALDNIKWNLKKEMELNQMFTKFLESQPIQNDREPANSINLDPALQHGKGFDDYYKEKLRENGGKKGEKQGNFKATPKNIAKAKAEISARNTIDVGKKESGNKTHKIVKKAPQTASYKNDSLNPNGRKKSSPKASPLVATRNSSLSTPSTRTTGASSAIGPTAISSGSAASRQKPHLSASNSRPGSKVERTRLLQKDVKKNQVDVKNSSKIVHDNKQEMTPRNGKIVKSKAPVAAMDKTVPLISELRSKMTKKSSVVPLESKPLECKASEIGPINTPTVGQTVLPSETNEPETGGQDLVSVREDGDVATVCELVNGQVDTEPIAYKIDTFSNVPRKLTDRILDPGDQEISDKMCGEGSETLQKVKTSLIEDESQPEIGHIISLSSWVEVGPPAPCMPICEHPGHRIHCSLSQMLLEENSETDVADWGNIENPATMVFQKDAPKGLKRLLKFVRKSKGEANLTGLSTPCNPEGEDDECKSLTNINSDKLLGNASLHVKNHGQQARPDNSNNSAMMSNKIHEVRISSTTTTKATRLFFSLSAFRGNKAGHAVFR